MSRSDGLESDIYEGLLLFCGDLESIVLPPCTRSQIHTDTAGEAFTTTHTHTHKNTHLHTSYSLEDIAFIIFFTS